MKFISGLLKLIAVGLLFFLILALPLTLFIQSAGSLLLSPGELSDLIEENLAAPEVFARIVESQLDQTENRQEFEDPFVRIMFDGINNLDQAQLEELVMLLAPGDLVNQTLDQILTGYYRWVENDNKYPRIVIDLRPWKRNLNTHIVPALEIVFNALPECTPEQQRILLLAGKLSFEAESCRPKEPVYGVMMEQASIALPGIIEELPDDYKLFDPTQADQSNDWGNIKENFSRAAKISQLSWVAVVVLFVVAVPLGARSLAGVFRWLGWPVLLSGIGLSLLAALLILFSRGFFVDYNPLIVMLRSGPVVLTRPLGNLVSDIFRSVARPMLIEAAVLILLGVSSIIIGKVISSRSKAEITGPVMPTQAATFDAGDQIVRQQPENTDTLELADQDYEVGPEDGDKPSGMFG